MANFRKSEKYKYVKISQEIENIIDLCTQTEASQRIKPEDLLKIIPEENNNNN